jgi:hypothetical protein
MKFIKMNNIKKLAVEYLLEELTMASFDQQLKLINKAKKMEKEQLCYFYNKGAEAQINNPYVSNIEFYNKTFNKNE